MTILIVEDEDGTQKVWRDILAPLNALIRVAQNVPEALEMMSKVPPPDLVLLDLRLPGSSHTNTLEHIAELKRINPQAVVVVITGMMDEALPMLAQKLGADGFHNKLNVSTQTALFDAIKTAFMARHTDPKTPAYAESSNLLQQIARLTLRAA